MSSYKEDILEIFEADIPWGILSGCNILVTGATGLLGGCLVEALMMNPKKDYHIYASGRNEERAKKRFGRFFDDRYFHFISYDVLKPLES